MNLPNIDFIDYYDKWLKAHKKHLEQERLRHPAIVIAKLCGCTPNKIRKIANGDKPTPQMQKLLDMVIEGKLK